MLNEGCTGRSEIPIKIIGWDKNHESFEVVDCPGVLVHSENFHSYIFSRSAINRLHLKTQRT